MTTQSAPGLDRESITDTANPLGLDGIQFIEYTTSRPQALGQVLEMMNFRPVARHRSREVLLYQQGSSIKVTVNANLPSLPSGGALSDKPVIAVTVLRVRDAATGLPQWLQL